MFTASSTHERIFFQNFSCLIFCSAHLGFTVNLKLGLKNAKITVSNYLLLLANLIQLLKPIIFFFIKCAKLNALFWNEMVWLLNTPKRRENQILRFLFKRKYSSCGCRRNIICNLRHNVQGRIHLSAAIPQCLLMKLRKSLVGRGSFITISNTIILTFVRSNFFSFH